MAFGFFLPTKVYATGAKTTRGVCVCVSVVQSTLYVFPRFSILAIGLFPTPSPHPPAPSPGLGESNLGKGDAECKIKHNAAASPRRHLPCLHVSLSAPLALAWGVTYVLLRSRFCLPRKKKKKRRSTYAPPPSSTNTQPPPLSSSHTSTLQLHPQEEERQETRQEKPIAQRPAYLPTYPVT